MSASLRSLLTDPESYGDGQPVDFVVGFHKLADGTQPPQRTLDLFLHDVRENRELRSSVPDITRENNSFRLTPAPLRLACSYLVTAWSGEDGEEGVLKEHAMLGRVAVAVVRSPVLPETHRLGSLGAMEPPPSLALAAPDIGRDEWWTAFGKKPRPHLVVTALLALPLAAAPTPVPMAAESRVRLADTPGQGLRHGPKGRFLVAGRVLDPEGKSVAGAIVRSRDLGASETTDTLGRFALGIHSAGNLELEVQSRPDAAVVSLTVTVPVQSPEGLELRLPATP